MDSRIRSCPAGSGEASFFLPRQGAEPFRAEAGLTNRGLSEEQAAKYLYPLRRRVRQGVTPASWKREQVRTELEDGADLEEGIATMQRAYVDRQRKTLLEGSFADWIGE